MKKLLIIVVTLIINLFTANITFAASATYYIDIDNGFDTNNGLSESSAWKTTANLSATSFAAGDIILFKRGQKWNGFSFTFPQNNMKLGAYGEGERPILSGAVEITGWEHYSGNIYKIPAVADSDKPLLIKVDNKLIRYAPPSTTIESLPENKYICIDDIIYYNSPDESPAGKLTEVQTKGTLVKIDTKKNITIENLHLTMGGSGAVHINSGKTENITVSNNEISFIESDNGVNGALTISSAKKCYFSKNIIHDVFGDGIMGWQTDDSIFSENHITRVFLGQNTGGDAIQISGNDKFGEQAATNNKIINNFTSMQGTDSGKGCIIHENGVNVIISGNIALYGNFGIEANSSGGIVENNFCAFQGVERPNLNWTAGLYMSEAMDITNMTWRNNIVYGCRPYGFNSVSQGSSSYIRNLNIYNNTIVNCGTPINISANTPFYGNIKNNILWSNSSSIYNISNIVEDKATEIDYNLINTLDGKKINFSKSTFSSLSSYRETTGNDIHSIAAAPLFVNADLSISNQDINTLDFHLYSNSPGVDRGDNIGLTSDYEEEAVPQDGGFNIGALETTVFSPDPTPDIPDEPIPETGEYRYVRGLYAYEGFDYRPTTPLNGLGSEHSGFLGAWSDNANGKVGTSTMTPDGVNSIGYKGLGSSLKRHFSSDIPKTGTFWFSCMIDLGSIGNDFYIDLGNNVNPQTNADNSNVRIHRQSNKNDYKWCLKPINASKDSTRVYCEKKDSKVFILMKLDINSTNTKASNMIWINPDLSNGEAGLGTADLSSTGSKKMDISNISISSGGTSLFEIDEIRLADNFEAVISGTYAMSKDVVADDIKLTSNSVAVSDILYALPDRITLEPSLYNAIPDSINKSVYSLFSIYCDNRILYQQTDSIALSEGDIKKEKISVTLPSSLINNEDIKLKGCTIKYFIWDADTLKPLCTPPVIEVMPEEEPDPDDNNE